MDVNRDVDSPRPTRRTARRRSQPLQRADIVGAAIRESDAGRLGAMTMRGLATDLQVTPMALYAHVADKDEILDEVLDHTLATMALPTAREWKQWMTEFAQQLHAMLCANPALLDRYLRRPVGVQAAVVRMEAALDAMRLAGLGDDECIEIFASVHACTVGFSALEVSRRTSTAVASATSGPPPRGLSLSSTSAGFWPAYFGSLPPTEFPNLHRIRPDLEDFASSERFLHVIDDLLAGHTPRATPGRSRNTKETTTS